MATNVKGKVYSSEPTILFGSGTVALTKNRRQNEKKSSKVEDGEFLGVTRMKKIRN